MKQKPSADKKAEGASPSKMTFGKLAGLINKKPEEEKKSDGSPPKMTFGKLNSML